MQLARRHVADRGMRNVELIEGDGRSTGLAAGSFDLVIARLVLVNVPRPEEIVREAVRLVRPGGTVAFHEADWLAHVSDPPLEAWTRLRGAIERYAATVGVDLFVGRRLPRLLRAAGLEGPAGGSRLIGEAELARHRAALRRHLEDPETLVVSHLFMQAWGRKPDGRG